MEFTRSKQIRSLLTLKELFWQGNFEPESTQRIFIIARGGVFTMLAWQVFIMALDQGHRVFPIVPFSQWEFLWWLFCPCCHTVYCMLRCGRKKTYLLVNRSPDYKVLHMDLMKKIVYYSALLDFELDAVTGWNFELYSLWREGGECDLVRKKSIQWYLIAKWVDCGRDNLAVLIEFFFPSILLSYR